MLYPLENNTISRINTVEKRASSPVIHCCVYQSPSHQVNDLSVHWNLSRTIFGVYTMTDERFTDWLCCSYIQTLR